MSSSDNEKKGEEFSVRRLAMAEEVGCCSDDEDEVGMSCRDARSRGDVQSLFSLASY